MFRERIADSLSRYGGRLGLLVGLPLLLFAGCGDNHTGVTSAIGAGNTGQVRAEVTANGQPLPGVTVTLTGPGGFSPQTLTTDANGAATFTGLANGSYNVTISGFNANQVGFTQTTVPATIDDNVGSVTVQFQGAGPGTGSVAGIMTVNGQAPSQLSGQTVTLTLVPPSGSPVTGTLTGTTGEFSFTGLAAGTYTLRAAVGSDVRTTTFTLAQGQQLQLNLEFASLPGATVVPIGTGTGQVRAQVTVDGQPLPGVTVTLTDGGQRTATTGADGIASFTDLPDATYTVTISGFDTNRALFTQTSAQATLNANVGLVTVQFEGTAAPTAGLTGVVTIGGLAPADLAGQPVTVTLTPASGTPVTGTLTGTTGQYTFTQLPAGTHTIAVTVGSVTRTTTVTLAQGEQRTLNLEFNSLTP